MATYHILGQEIYQETGGATTPACARTQCQNPLWQVLEEISARASNGRIPNENEKWAFS